MIETEGAINFHNYQVRVLRYVPKEGSTTWYTHLIIDDGERLGTQREFFIGVSGTSKSYVLLETGMRLQQYLDSKK